MTRLFSSPKTTTVGITAFLALLGQVLAARFDADPNTIPDWEALVLAAFVMLHGLFARDNDKRSEDVGAGGGWDRERK